MTLFIHCELPKEIHPHGWDNWRNPENEKTARYAEYNNSGVGSDTAQRVNWMKILSPGEAQEITPEVVMGEFYKKIVAEFNL